MYDLDDPKRPRNQWFGILDKIVNFHWFDEFLGFIYFAVPNLIIIWINFVAKNRFLLLVFKISTIYLGFIKELCTNGRLKYVLWIPLKSLIKYCRFTLSELKDILQERNSLKVIKNTHKLRAGKYRRRHKALYLIYISIRKTVLLTDLV